MANEEEDFGEQTEVKKRGNPNNVWIGAKFEKSDDTDKEIISKFEDIKKRCGGNKRAVAEMIVYVHKKEFS